MNTIKDPMDEWYELMKEFINDKLEKTGTEGVVLGLSGGLDSAVILKTCVDTISTDQITCLMMPESATPKEDTEDAIWLATKWGVTYVLKDIDGILESFDLEVHDRAAYANLKARIRMCILYYHANLENKLVVGTCNKSELLVGYSTKYGDGASDLLPIGDIYKSDLKYLAEHIGVPKRILVKAPRAGLWEGQTDEAELGYTYEVLDSVLKGIESNSSIQSIAQKTGVSLDDVERIRSMVVRSAHKRQPPQVLKLRSRTVGLDWREFSY